MIVLAAENSIRQTLALEIELLAPILGARLKAADVTPEIRRIERVIIEHGEETIIDGEPEPLDADAVIVAPEPEPPPPPPEPPRNVVRLNPPLFGLSGQGR